MTLLARFRAFIRRVRLLRRRRQGEQRMSADSGIGSTEPSGSGPPRRPIHETHADIRTILQTLYGGLQAYQSGYGDYHHQLEEYVAAHFSTELISEILQNFEVAMLELPTPMSNPNMECFCIATLQVLFACPPFVNFIRTNELDTAAHDENVPTTRQAQIDRAMKSILAQFLVGSPIIHCTPLLQLVTNVNEQDAEEFFQTLHGLYCGEILPLPKQTTLWTCDSCHSVTISDPEPSIFNLPTRLPGQDRTNMMNLIFHKTGFETEKRICKFCKDYSDGFVHTKYIFSNILRVYGHTDGSHAEFEEVVDLTEIDNSGEPSMWQLAGTVHYRSFGNVSSGNRRSCDGHYTAVVYHKNRRFLMDDRKRMMLPTNSDVPHFYGEPYYAVYYKMDWMESNGRGQNQ
ncbi:hypothetical protein B9Z55_022739 [Caenorhabditis nigoni]|uniref:USP domain-containing protein n=1 Tax=Caenorhabditis nigoni TaxID=1611254 RepID=A0A2G5SLR8_9PELO|nr:hypothetical protein B9Z55_022739 [Caenorhabditis nigoni]